MLLKYETHCNILSIIFMISLIFSVRTRLMRQEMERKENTNALENCPFKFTRAKYVAHILCIILLIFNYLDFN